MLSQKFELGDLLKDDVTGFEGVVTGVTRYMTGCIHYGLQSRHLKDGKPFEWEWFDQSRLTLVERQVIPLKTLTATSGPCANPPSVN